MSDPMMRQLLEDVLVMMAEIKVMRQAMVRAIEDESLIAVDEQLEAHRLQVVRPWIDRTFTEKKAEIILPARCHEEDSEKCGRQNPDAVSQRPGWEPMCKGCGLDPSYE